MKETGEHKKLIIEGDAAELNAEQETGSVKGAENLREKQEKLEILAKELEQDSQNLAGEEKTIVEQPNVISEREFAKAAIAGRTRDTFHKLAGKFALAASLLVSTSSGSLPISPENLAPAGERRLEEKRLEYKYGSPEYKAAVARIRMAFESQGFNEPPSLHALDDDRYRYWQIIYSMPESDAVLIAIREENRRRDNQELQELLEREKTEKGRLPRVIPRITFEEWQKAKKESGAEESLQEGAVEFGIDPYKRLHAHRYEEFNEDVISITGKMNKRIEELNRTTGTEYPPVEPGMVAATALQEGLALKFISDKGYDPEATTDTFLGLGLDCLSEDLERLQKLGLLEKDYDKKLIKSPSANKIHLGEEIFGVTKATEQGIHNEAGLKIKMLRGSTRNLMEGLAAVLVDKRNSVIDAVGRKEWDSFNREEQDWLTYAAYQWGQGNVAALLREEKIPLRYEGRSVPIQNFVRYEDGFSRGRVSNIKEFIWKDNGRQRISYEEDFHYTASQVAVQSRASNKILEYLKQSNANALARR
ncbi:MAG: hypothetical protein AAB897_00545 [Patescibacteria group bacterium]